VRGGRLRELGGSGKFGGGMKGGRPEGRGGRTGLMSRRIRWDLLMGL
jgi:hypothetical protein